MQVAVHKWTVRVGMPWSPGLFLWNPSQVLPWKVLQRLKDLFQEGRIIGPVPQAVLQVGAQVSGGSRTLPRKVSASASLAKNKKWLPNNQILTPPLRATVVHILDSSDTSR